MADTGNRTIQLQDAMQAQRALREAAGMGPEEFPVQAFVGMISDEIEALRKRGYSDDAIAELIAKNSAIKLSAGDIAEHYAPPEARQRG